MRTAAFIAALAETLSPSFRVYLLQLQDVGAEEVDHRGRYVDQGEGAALLQVRRVGDRFKVRLKSLGVAVCNFIRPEEAGAPASADAPHPNSDPPVPYPGGSDLAATSDLARGTNPTGTTEI